MEHWIGEKWDKNRNLGGEKLGKTMDNNYDLTRVVTFERDGDSRASFEATISRSNERQRDKEREQRKNKRIYIGTSRI